MNEVKQYLEDEVMLAEKRLSVEDDNPMYGGVNVGAEQARKLNENHIAFCKRIIKMIG